MEVVEDRIDPSLLQPYEALGQGLQNEYIQIPAGDEINRAIHSQALQAAENHSANLQRRYSEPYNESWQNVYRQQTAEIQNLRAELRARKETSMDDKQFQQILEIQKLSVSSLREQKDKTVLDKLAGKTSKKLMEYLLTGFHLSEDLAKAWGPIFAQVDEEEDPVTITNVTEVNMALKEQSKLLEDFNN